MLAARHFNRGNQLSVGGNFERAIESFRKSLELNPDDPEAWLNLGCAQWKLGQLDEAEQSFVRAIVLRPEYAAAHNNLGGVLDQQAKTAEAVVHYREAIRLQPDYAQAHSNLARAHLREARIGDAIRHYHAAVEHDPGNADYHSNLGVALQADGHTALAERCLRQALQIDRNHRRALTNLGDVLRGQGDFDGALAAYRKASRLDARDCALKAKLALAQPVILASSTEPAQLRRRTIEGLEALVRQKARIEDPNRDVGATNFYLAYHGLNDVEIQSTIAAFYLKVCPELGWTPAHCARPRGAGQRIRLGIISSCLRDHTIGKFYRGLIERLSRERIDLTLFRPRHRDDAVAEAIDRAAGKVVEIPRDLFSARALIAAERQAVLFYPEIGMDPLIYFLAFARLAPAQCVSWGHPVTTGLPEIDYFISARTLEPPGATSHYSECLIEFDRLPTYYLRPEHADLPAARAHLGFPQDTTVYLCPQSLFKFHPEFDIALATLLRRDPRGRIVLIAGNHASWSRRLAARIVRSFPDVAERVVFAPRVPQKQFSYLLHAADVLLDPPYFGGGNTSYEAFAAGLPIVTWPGPFMRGRVTAACYEQMGFTELVAADLDSYVDIAVRLANDAEWRTHVCAEIRARSQTLYEDLGVVDEFERFVVAAAEAASRGEKVVSWGK